MSAAETEFRKALELKYPADDVYPVLAWALVRRVAPKKRSCELANVTLADRARQAPTLAPRSARAYMGSGQPKEARAAIDAALALRSRPTSTRASRKRA